MSRYRSKRIVARSSDDATLNDAISEFMLYHERKGDSESYLRELRSYLIGGGGRYGKRRLWSPFLPWIHAKELLRPADLSREQVGAYLDYVRMHTGHADYGKICAILKRLFRFFVTEGWIEQEPLRIERPKRLKAEIKVFTPVEMDRLRKVVSMENARDWAIFMLLLDTGMRASELCNLRFDDLRWERQELIIRPQIAKNRCFRIIPLSGSIKALRKYRAMRGDDVEQCERLFLSFYQTPVFVANGRRRILDKIVFSDKGLTRNGLFFLVSKWGKLANITESRCSPHTFRHYFACEYLKAGGNILSLQKLLGHSRLDITERYLRYTATDVKAEHARFSPAINVEQRRRRRPLSI